MQVCISKVACNNSEPQPLDNFYTHPAMGNGHLSKCKDCCKMQQRERTERLRSTDPIWVAKEAERMRIKERNRYYRLRDTPEFRERIAARRKAVEANKAQEPMKKYARNALRRAVLAGKIIKPLYCQECGFAHPIIEAHHPDYSKPLEVVWLCKQCHIRETWPSMKANS